MRAFPSTNLYIYMYSQGSVLGNQDSFLRQLTNKIEDSSLTFVKMKECLYFDLRIIIISCESPK